MSPHPANLWVGTELEAQVDRLLQAMDAAGVAAPGQDPGKDAQALIRYMGPLPKGDAWESEAADGR